jgi:hypothetical protein
MSEVLRKKSPRAPSLALDESVERALKIYDKEHRHPVPTDVIAQNLGYKSANNGSALSAIASLRSYNLLEKAQEGKLSVSKDVESYKYAPNEELRSQLKIKWLRAPSIFSELLEQYGEGLPSDATLRFELINRGFAPPSADSTLAVFKKSVEFAHFFEQAALEGDEAVRAATATSSDASTESDEAPVVGLLSPVANGYDRIPVRLNGGRRAWLEIPTPFYLADKKRLYAQIELLLTEDEEAAAGAPSG